MFIAVSFFFWRMWNWKANIVGVIWSRFKNYSSPLATINQVLFIFLNQSNCALSTIRGFYCCIIAYQIYCGTCMASRRDTSGGEENMKGTPRSFNLNHTQENLLFFLSPQPVSKHRCAYSNKRKVEAHAVIGHAFVIHVVVLFKTTFSSNYELLRWYDGNESAELSNFLME